MKKEAVMSNIDFKELSKNCKSIDDINKLTKQFMKNMIENMLNAEIEEFSENNENISRNGYYSKTVRSDSVEIELNIPRDRKSEFAPQVVKKGQKNISGIDEKIISMYARGMSLRDIEKQVKEMYDVDMSDSLLSRIIEKITTEIKAWQGRTLESIYPYIWMLWYLK